MNLGGEKKMEVWLLYVAVDQLNIGQGKGQIQGHRGLPCSSFPAGDGNDHERLLIAAPPKMLGRS
jgi:hypothetical protein